VCEAFKYNLLVLNHSASLVNSQCAWSSSPASELCSKKAVVSSADNISLRIGDTLVKSVIYSIDNNGPRLEPRGTTCT